VKVIVCVKDGIVGNALAILLLAGLSGFTIWWGISHDHVVLFIAPVFCVPWLYVCYVAIRNIRSPKSSTLAIDGDQLTWTLRTVESAAGQQNSIPLHSIDSLEFVLPVKRYMNGERDYSLAELFIVDVHGNRHQLPVELFPGVYRKKIISAIEHEKPGVRVVERMDDAEER
jgi:hypothetical protein